MTTTSLSEDFPRGGAEDSLFIAPVELKRVQKQAEKDFSTSKAKKAKKQPSDLPNVPIARPLTFKSLAEGMIFLGCVRGVSDLEVEIGLPNHLIAHLPITLATEFISKELEAFQSNEQSSEFEPPRLKDFFFVSQLLPVAISELQSGAGLKKSGKIIVTCMPRKIAAFRGLTRASGIVSGLVCAAEVASIEDRGYILDIGVKGGAITWLPGGGTDCKPLIQGQLLIVQIQQQSSGSEGSHAAFHARIYEPLEEKAVLNVAGPLLFPGQRVKGTVLSVQKQGALVQLLEGSSSSSDHHHNNAIVTVDCMNCTFSRLEVGSSVIGMISRYATDDQPAGITIIPQGERKKDNVDHSNLIGKRAQARILRIDNGIGLLVELQPLDSSFSPVNAYVMASKVDGDLKDLQLDSIHMARIIDYDPLDCLLHASIRALDFDQPFVSYSELTLGMIVKGTVARVDSFGLIVEIGERIRGLAPTIWCSPLSKWHVGDTRKFMIIDLDVQAKRVILCAKKAMFHETALHDEDLAVGNAVNGLVSSIKACGAIVLFGSGLRGLVPMKELGKHQDGGIQEGKVCNFIVIRSSRQGGVLLKPSPPQLMNSTSLASKSSDQSDIIKNIDQIQIGQSITGKITKIDPASGILVTLPICGKRKKRLIGRIFITDISSEAIHPTDGFWIDQKITCTIIDIKGEMIDLSLLPQSDSHSPSEETHLLQLGSIISGNVINICKSGIFVAIDRKLTGRIQLKELSLNFTKDWQNAFRLGERVSAKIMRLPPQLDLSIKAMIEDSQHEALALLETGARFECTVVAVKDYGIFLRIGETLKSGLCHKSNCPPNFANLFSSGDRVRARVLSNDQGKISLSLLETDSDDHDDQENHTNHYEQSNREQDKNYSCANLATSQAVASSTTQIIQESTGFDWSVATADDHVMNLDQHESEDENLSDTAEDQQQGTTSTKKLTKRQRLLREDLIMKREIALHSQAETYATEDQLKQSLLSTPHSSAAYIQAMNWYIQRSLLDEARKIARLALSRIPFGMDGEKMNIWLALLALEHLYGPQGNESALEALLLEARQSTNEKAFLISLARMFYHTPGSHPERSGMIYKLLTKRFPESLKAWKLRIMHCFLIDRPSEGRELQKQAMRSLPLRKHVKATVQWALCELKMPRGSIDIARTHFEALLAKYPKRLDLWIVYFQSEAFTHDPQGKCVLLERVSNMSWSAKKMRFILGEWMAVAKTLVDLEARASEIKKVKTVALRFVESQRVPE